MEAEEQTGYEETVLPSGLPGLDWGCFWQVPPDGRRETFTFYNPPLQPAAKGQFSARELKEQVEEIVEALKDKGLPLHAMELKWQLLVEVLASAESLEGVRKEVQSQMRNLEQLRGQVESLLLIAQEKLGEALAEAGLAFPDSLQPTGPSEVLRAVRDSCPSLEEFAGMIGVEPVQEERSGRKFVDNLIELIAPLACGSVLALTLGTVTGLFDLAQLNLDDPLLTGRLTSLGLLGFTVGKLIGEALGRSVRSVAFALEGHCEETCPRHWSFLVLVLQVLGMLAVAAADVTVEALGISLLHRQMIERSFGEASQLQPWWVYGLAGLILTGPWLLYKATKAWREAEVRLRRAWLLHRQSKWIQERLESEPVRRALKMAGIVETLQAKLQEIEEREQELKQRLDAAYAQAVGTMDLFNQRLHEYIEACEAFPPRRKQEVRA